MPLDIPLDAGAMMQIMWLVLLIVFAASEAITVGLTSIWFAAGALAALVAALLGGAVWIQITLFLAVSLLCLAAVRPLAKRHLNSKVESKRCDFMTWDVPVKDNCPICGQTMFKLSGRGFKRPFCINEGCSNFLPEDKRGGFKKKTEAAAEGESAESAEEKSAAKKAAPKKAAAKKTASSAKTTAAKKTTAKKTTAKKTTAAKKAAE